MRLGEEKEKEGVGGVDFYSRLAWGNWFRGEHVTSSNSHVGTGPLFFFKHAHHPSSLFLAEQLGQGGVTHQLSAASLLKEGSRNLESAEKSLYCINEPNATQHTV